MRHAFSGCGNDGEIARVLIVFMSLFKVIQPIKVDRGRTKSWSPSPIGLCLWEQALARGKNCNRAKEVNGILEPFVLGLPGAPFIFSALMPPTARTLSTQQLSNHFFPVSLSALFLPGGIGGDIGYRPSTVLSTSFFFYSHSKGQ